MKMRQSRKRLKLRTFTLSFHFKPEGENKYWRQHSSTHRLLNGDSTQKLLRNLMFCKGTSLVSNPSIKVTP